MSVFEILLEQVVRLHTDAQNKGGVEHGGFDPALWVRIEELGLPLAMCAEADGGFELGWSDLLDVIAHSAACGEPTPLGETLVANRLLGASGISPEPGAIVFANCVTPGASTSSPMLRLLTAEEGRLTLAALDDNSAGVAELPQIGRDLLLAGALLRAIQIAGALQGALDLSVRYAQERVQFGRPLSKFQAVQHMLAQLADEAVATAAAARTACARMDAGDADLAIAIAKLRAGRAVEKGAMLAHQIHGAIGVTLEYPLSRLSRNMWRWADQFGDHKHWAIEVGRTAMASPGAWQTVVAASDPLEGNGHGNEHLRSGTSDGHDSGL